MMPPLSHFRRLDTVTLVCPLGVGFFDVATGRAVSEGLRVCASPTGAPGRRRWATVNRSGLFVFRGLPGLHEAEHGSGDDVDWQNLTTRRTFVVQVNDLQGRFLPFQFTAQLPHRGLFSLEDIIMLSPVAAWELEQFPSVPLFSAPSRSVPPGLAVLRAELREADGETAAAWALIEVTLPGRAPALGVADERGICAVILPYPEPNDAFPASPLVPGKRLDQQQWSVGVRAFYGAERRVPPDLGAVLLQPATRLWQRLSPPEEITGTTLRFGREIVLGTPGERLVAVSD
jgi:hypothetical protein